jgi:spermidine synthase
MILIPTRVMVCALSEEKIKVHSNPQALSLIYESEFKSILLTDTVYNINSRSEIYMTEVFLLAKSLFENKYRSMLCDFFFL